MCIWFINNYVFLYSNNMLIYGVLPFIHSIEIWIYTLYMHVTKAILLKLCFFRNIFILYSGNTSYKLLADRSVCIFFFFHLKIVADIGSQFTNGMLLWYLFPGIKFLNDGGRSPFSPCFFFDTLFYHGPPFVFWTLWLWQCKWRFCILMCFFIFLFFAFFFSSKKN